MRFDSEFFWTNPRYDIIYNHLLNWIYQHQGVMVLTGEAGTGKTFLLRELMQAAGGDIRFVFCNYFSNLDFDDLLNLVCRELDLTPQESSRLYKLKALSDYLNNCFKKGKSTALLIDEAHNLDEDVVSHLVTLSRSGFKDGRSLQIVLSGLPALGEKLAYWKTLHPTMADVLENRLEPLTTAEVAAFIRHQLRIAGSLNNDLFPEPVLESIARYARVPRLINMFCDRALRTAQTTKQTRISPAMIDEIADELLLKEPNSNKPEPAADSLNPATAPKAEHRGPVIHNLVQAKVKAAANTDQITGTVSFAQPGLTEKTEMPNTVQPADAPVSTPPGVANQRPARRRGRAWIALLLVISIGAAGGYALQQHYGSDRIAAEARQALAAVYAYWSSLSSKIVDTVQVLKSEPAAPPGTPEIAQTTPPPPEAGSIHNTAVAEAQQAVPPPESVTAIPISPQAEPSTELPKVASAAEAAVQLEEISDAAKRALEVIETQWSSIAAGIAAGAQALKPEPPLPPPAIEAPAFTAASTEESLAETDAETDAENEPTQTAAATSLPIPVAVPPEIYMRKGDELFELADMASARLYYEAAVKAGYAAAMIAVGKTYDPLVVNSLAIRGTHAEPIKAAEWYRKASQAGVPEASERLDKLQRWLADSPPLGEAEGIALQQLLQR